MDGWTEAQDLKKNDDDIPLPRPPVLTVGPVCVESDVLLTLWDLSIKTKVTLLNSSLKCIQ